MYQIVQRNALNALDENDLFQRMKIRFNNLLPIEIFIIAVRPGFKI